MSAHTPERGDPFDVAVVIVNYNGGSLLAEVVAAASASEGLRLGIVVVDNGSTDRSHLALRSQPAVAAANSVPLVLIESGANLGFAGGNNLGLYALQARYIVLLNNDALVEPGTLAILVRFMDRYQDVGACAPRLTWPDGTPQPYSYGSDPTPGYLLRRAWSHRRGRTLHAWGSGAPGPVEWVAGTCMVLRAAALARCGVLDEQIFMYFEDNELCLRLRRGGWQIYFVPEVGVRHFNRPSYRDRVRRARYYAGLAHFYRRRYGRAAGIAMALLGRLRMVR